MTSTLNFQISSAIDAQNIAKSGKNPESGADSAGVPSAFSTMFAALMTGKPGQQVADLEGKASPPANLAAEALSPTINIITTTDTVMSDDSLLAFARAQGLDDKAMDLIFTPQAPASDQSMAPDFAGLQAMARPSTHSGLDGSAASQPGPTTLSALSALAPESSVRWSPEKTGLPEGQPLTRDGLKPVLFGLNGVQAAVSMAPTTVAHIDTPASDQVERHNLVATLMLGAAEAAQWSKRLQVRAVGLRADNLTQSAASLSSKSSLTMTTTAAAASSAPLETLMIGQEISGEDLPAIWAQRLGANGQPGQGPAGGGEESAHAEQALRSEQYEKLSQRLGEALGQRLAAQIARGEWKVELALNPHKLGKIDIQLDMRRGELEASFKTSNPMTRDLLIDGLPRLKEVLAQSGMEVAQMNVNTRQDRQNGGNPTPGRQQQSGPSDSDPNGSATSNVSSGQVAPRKQTDRNDGLDVRV